MTLTESVLNGDRLALARLLTQVENLTADGRLALAALFPHSGKAHLIGVTGAPGTGKSTLVNRLALHYRSEQKRVAVVAVDPSSPFTGGAVLGDRVRMRDLSGDAGVFIRSMASRGSVGGIAQATASIAQVFDAAGYDIVIIDTPPLLPVTDAAILARLTGGALVVTGRPLSSAEACAQISASTLCFSPAREFFSRVFFFRHNPAGDTNAGPI